MNKKILDKKTILSLKKILQRQPQVLAAYLFGSQAEGFAAKKSDFDLGLFVKNIEKINYNRIYSRIALGFTGQKIDVRLIDINNFSPLFAFNVIKPGFCLYQKNENTRVQIEKRVMDTYFDSQHIREIYHHYLGQSLKKGTFGHAIKFNT